MYTQFIVISTFPKISLLYLLFSSLTLSTCEIPLLLFFEISIFNGFNFETHIPTIPAFTFRDTITFVQIIRSGDVAKFS